MNAKSKVARWATILALFSCPMVRAQTLFGPISSPDSSYVDSTTRINITAPDNYGVFYLSDGNLRISFTSFRPESTIASAQTVGVSWSTWSSPPYSESPMPRLLWWERPLLGMTFSQPLQTFGVEIQLENYYAVGDVTMSFFDGPVEVGSITRSISGASGARLFGAHSDLADFDSVVVNAPASSPLGFGMAQFRYTVVPEPSVPALVLVALCALFCGHLRRRVRKRPRSQPVLDS